LQGSWWSPTKRSVGGRCPLPLPLQLKVFCCHMFRDTSAPHHIPTPCLICPPHWNPLEPLPNTPPPPNPFQERALLALKKKKLNEHQLELIASYLMNVEDVVGWLIALIRRLRGRSGCFGGLLVSAQHRVPSALMSQLHQPAKYNTHAAATKQPPTATPPPP
jgi:hypothetical protein